MFSRRGEKVCTSVINQDYNVKAGYVIHNKPRDVRGKFKVMEGLLHKGPFEPIESFFAFSSIDMGQKFLN